jgi:DMSO reductase family type II enzyme heme b subunit
MRAINHPLARALLLLLASALLLWFGFPPLMPLALFVPAMVTIAIAILLYYASDEALWREFTAPLVAIARQPRWWPVRLLMVGALSAISATATHHQLADEPSIPFEPRQAHPAPPQSIMSHGRRIDLTTLENPLRREIVSRLEQGDQAGAISDYMQQVDRGRRVYYQNCIFCHGDLLEGSGPFATGQQPAPADFHDIGTIAQLSEGYLFWRIALGAGGMPGEGGPWNSTMPAWQDRLSEEEIWQVILFLYDATGHLPRIWDTATAERVMTLNQQLQADYRTLSGDPLYQRECAICHGEHGMGDGVAADRLYPRPRDLSLALFRYRSSPPESLPRDEDLFAVIHNGLPGSSMPGWSERLDDKRIASLIPVIKRFDITGFWAPADAGDEEFDDNGLYTGDSLRTISKQEPLPAPPVMGDSDLERGQELYNKACRECHGSEGRGDIPSGKPLADDWGERIWPRNLTRPWSWRMAAIRPYDNNQEWLALLYHTISIGLSGTPMPAHRAIDAANEDPIDERGRWQIAHFVNQLARTGRPPANSPLAIARQTDRPLPTTIDDPVWSTIEPVSLPLIPNVSTAEPLFRPLNEGVELSAIHDGRELLVRLAIDDRSESRPGHPPAIAIQDQKLPLHPDAFALQLPAAANSWQMEPSIEKPLLLHGDPARPVLHYYWSAGSVEPAVAPWSALLRSQGGRPEPTGSNPPKIDAEWRNGRWLALIRIALDNNDAERLALIDGYLPLAVANWDGSNGEYGSRHTYSGWAWLRIEQRPGAAAVWGGTLLATLLPLLFGLPLVHRHPGQIRHSHSNN